MFLSTILCPFCTRAAPFGQDGCLFTADDCIGCTGTLEVADLRNSNNRRGDVVRRSKRQLTVAAPRAVRHQRAGNETPSDLGPEASRGISAALNMLLADMFAMHMKTKNFHWHMSGPNFRDFHLLLDEQAEKIYATTDIIAERVRKLGAPTLRSIGDISRRQRLLDNDNDGVARSRCLVSCATALIFFPSTLMSTRTGGDPMSQSQMS